MNVILLKADHASTHLLDIRKADELQLFASNSNPVCLVEEHDSPMGPKGEMMQVQLVPQD